MGATLPFRARLLLTTVPLLFAVGCETSIDYPIIGGVYVSELALSSRSSERTSFPKDVSDAAWPVLALRIDTTVGDVVLVKYQAGEKYADADFRYEPHCGCFVSTRDLTFTPIPGADERSGYSLVQEVAYMALGESPEELALWYFQGGARMGPYSYRLTYVDQVDLSTHRDRYERELGFGALGPSMRDGLLTEEGIARLARMPGAVFQDRLRSGGTGPHMVVIPAGRFRMGDLSPDGLPFGNMKPDHDVVIPKPFALSVYEIPFENYDRFADAEDADDEGWGRRQRPAIHVSWADAQRYVNWLSAQTGGDYRLPSEAEWEYAARAGTTTKYSWGDELGENRANCGRGCASRWFHKTAPIGSYEPNAFGLFDMHGNVAEWVQDCWNESYDGAPLDGSAWLVGECRRRVVRGGSWWSQPPHRHRSAYRSASGLNDRSFDVGLRVARTLEH